MIELIAADPDHADKKFVWYDTKNFEDHAVEGLGCTGFPCISLVQLKEENDEDIYTKTLPEISKEHIQSFFQDHKDGKLTPVVFPEMDDMEDEDYEDEDFSDDEDENMEDIGEAEPVEM